MTIVPVLGGAAAALLLAGGLNCYPRRPRCSRTWTSRTPGRSLSPTARGIGATVAWNESVDELVKTRGREDLVYFAANVQDTSVFTNLATGKTYTNVYNFTDATRTSWTTATGRSP